MAIKPVLRMGDPRLLEPSRAVKKFRNAELDELILDLRDTMASLNGAGLAAPQIGVNLQVVIFGVEANPRALANSADAEVVPFTILINPKLTPLDDEMEEGWEGCLSVPGMRGLVPRHVNLRYQGFDEKGKKIARTVTDFHARVVQHECDHLAGILYPMRIRDLRNFGFTAELFPGEDIADD